MKYLAAILVLTMASVASAADRPNFVVVLIDDMGWEHRYFSVRSWPASDNGRYVKSLPGSGHGGK